MWKVFIVYVKHSQTYKIAISYLCGSPLTVFWLLGISKYSKYFKIALRRGYETIYETVDFLVFIILWAWQFFSTEWDTESKR